MSDSENEIICTYCDSKFSSKLNECINCESTIDDIKKFVPSSINSVNNDDDSYKFNEKDRNEYSLDNGIKIKQETQSVNISVSQNQKITKVNYEREPVYNDNEYAIGYNNNNPGQKNNWTCRYCSAINDCKNANCDVCYEINELAIKPQVPQQSILKPTTNSLKNDPNWYCLYCHIQNTSRDYTCKTRNCNNKAPFYGKWCCEICTCFNESFSTDCKACRNQNQNLNPCTKCNNVMVNNIYDSLCIRCKNVPEIVKPELQPIKKKNEQPKPTHKIDTTNNNNNNNNNNYKKCKQCNKVTYNKIGYCIDCCWTCSNRFCEANDIMPFNNFCYKCGLQKDSNIIPGNLIIVKSRNKNKGFKTDPVWQCTYCGKFLHKNSHKCYECTCPRLENNKNLCVCHWVSSSQSNNCTKCHLKLS